MNGRAATGIELHTLLRRPPHAVGVDNLVVAHDADLALRTNLSCDPLQHGMALRSAESRANARSSGPCVPPIRPVIGWRTPE